MIKGYWLVVSTSGEEVILFCRSLGKLREEIEYYRDHEYLDSLYAIKGPSVDMGQKDFFTQLKHWEEEDDQSR